MSHFDTAPLVKLYKYTILFVNFVAMDLPKKESMSKEKESCWLDIFSSYLCNIYKYATMDGGYSRFCRQTYFLNQIS